MEYFTNTYNFIHNTISGSIDFVIALFTYESLYASVITGFLYLSKMATYTKIKTRQLLQNYPMANTVFERIGNFKKTVYSTLFNYRIEPAEPNWTNITTIVPVKNMKCFDSCCQDTDCCMTTYKIEETYQFIPENASNDDINKYYSLLYLDAKTAKLREKTALVDLFTMKTSNSYIIRNITNDNNSKTECFNLTPSKARFISIMYSHPKLTNPVYIELPKNMYLVGNELLSSAFVVRYLEHQSMPYVFDFDYTLHIIDNHIKQFNLNSRQYILLTERGYSAVNFDIRS